jgi:hypothetical protein
MVGKALIGWRTQTLVRAHPLQIEDLIFNLQDFGIG